MQTAEQVKQRLIELEKNYNKERRELIEEYKQLSPIQVGDKVKVTHKNADAELGECVELNIGYGYVMEPVLHKLKKDGTVHSNARLYIWDYSSTLEKL
jgi:regulator of sigma D